MLDELRAAVKRQDVNPKEALVNCIRLVECEGTTLADCHLAEDVARRAAARLPEDREAQLDLAYVLECTGDQYMREATAVYRSLGEATGSPRAWGAYVVAERRTLNSDRAVRTLHARLCTRPEDTGARRALLSALLYADQPSDALAAVDAALATEPNEAGLHDTRGNALARLGRPAEAEAEWRRALELDPRNIGPRYTLAFAYENRGERAAALAEWNQILVFLLREFPDDPAYLWAESNVKRLSG